jgi:RecA-family ATPase
MTRELPPGAFHERIDRSKRMPLTLTEWLTRDLPQADLLLPCLSTTSRVLFAAPTGIGKTMFGIGLGMGCAARLGYLHWESVRPAHVLFVDGEMSRRLLQQRLTGEAKRLNSEPGNFHVLSHEDVENFLPLNMPEGQAFIETVITRIGGADNLDLIIFDNVACLLAGNMKETKQWAATLP